MMVERALIIYLAPEALRIIIILKVALQLRLYAIYGSSRKILAFLVSTFIVTYGIILYFLARIVSAERGMIRILS